LIQQISFLYLPLCNVNFDVKGCVKFPKAEQLSDQLQISPNKCAAE